VRIGVYGGTFNPPHLGHLVCAQEAYLQLGLDRILLVPAARPPHKPVPEDPGTDHRLALSRLAIGDDERMDVCELEITRGGTSFTVDTLKELKSTDPDSELFLILGGDNAAGLPSWREPETIIELAIPALAGRRGTSWSAVEEAMAKLSGGDRAVRFAMPTVEISSTMIRRRAAAGRSIRYLVPDAVAGYIAEHRLYQT
jgi:nicotinate-nucleotide adenylyltransferase